MKILSSILLTIGLTFGSVAHANIMVWLDPGEQTSTGNGDNISFTLMVGGLGDFSPDSLGGFDLDIDFDSSALSFDSYNLFGGLGDVDLFEALDLSWGDNGLGEINLAQLSFLSEAELDALQPDTFSLAELFFTVEDLDNGDTTALSLNINEFTDAAGTSLTVDTGDDAIISVPTPAPQLLLGLALLSLFIRKQTSNNPLLIN